MSECKHKLSSECVGFDVVNCVKWWHCVKCLKPIKSKKMSVEEWNAENPTMMVGGL